jgi:hypothetical protein
MPHVFVSQRWVAPPDMMECRGQNELPHKGGEYLNLYWSTGSVDEMTKDFAHLGGRLTAVGRMEPMKYLERTWGSRLQPVSFQTPPGGPLGGEAVVASTVTTGLFVVIGEVFDTPRKGDFMRWHEDVHNPMILETGLFVGEAKLMPPAVDGGPVNSYVGLYYTNDPDPKKVWTEFGKIAASWRAEGKDFPDVASARKIVFGGMFKPSMGHYEYYD